VGLVGHGLRERQLCGVLEPDGPCVFVVLVVRRYRCRWCSATMTVVPKGVVSRRRYSGFAVAWALWLYGVAELGLEHVREQVAPGVTFEAGWASVRRWIEAAGAGRLFDGVRPWPSYWTLRQRARRICMTLLARVAGDERDPQPALYQATELAA
jgi:hypothetical protein